MDHHFQGKPVLPAVEAMEALAQVVKEKYPRQSINHLTDASFKKFLFLEPDADQLEAIAELKILQNGGLQATLLTRTRSPKAAFTRTKNHVELTFDPSPPRHHRYPLDTVAALTGICTMLSPEEIYRDLVPFGPTFRNIQSPLLISQDGAMARIQTPRQKHHRPGGPGLLGSGYALDAAFHAACVWAQHFKGIVAFPVAVDRRTVIKPTRPENTYIGRVIPNRISDTLLSFDILLLDENGLVCESAQGVQMRDVSGGRLQPPNWIRSNRQPDPFKLFKEMLQDMVIVELDTVADFAHTALSPLESQRYQKMGNRRRKSYLAARMAMKTLYRQGRNNDTTTPADQIETVYKNSPLPCAGRCGSSEQRNCSVSHDRRFAIGVVDSRPVGVDVEVISPKAIKGDRIFMSAAEQQRVKASTMEQISVAVRIWSAKEAVAKAMGMDLADAWEQVQVIEVDESESKLMVDGKSLTAQHVTVDRHLFTLVSTY